MFKKIIITLIFLVSYKAESSWGFYAHKKIHKMAVYVLPQSMNDFFLRHIDLLEAYSVNADKRRYSIKNEASRHYIDMDAYDIDSPFVVVPKKWIDTVEKYTEDTLLEYGVLPWHIQKQYYQLIEAFKKNDASRVIHLCSDIGHYISDAHVPLHTTINYNGQLSNQYGIHACWESRLPELFSDNYNFVLPKVKYIENILDLAWIIVENSYDAKDSVLTMEAQLNAEFYSDKKFSFEEKKKKSRKVYSKQYSERYHQMLNGMVERQMRSSVHTVASVWYSAWVESGQPDMSQWVVD